MRIKSAIFTAPLCLGQVRLGVLGFWKSQLETNEEMAMGKHGDDDGKKLY